MTTVDDQVEDYFSRLMNQRKGANPYIHIKRVCGHIDHRQVVLKKLIDMCRLLDIKIDVDNVSYVNGVIPYKIRLSFL